VNFDSVKRYGKKLISSPDSTPSIFVYQCIISWARNMVLSRNSLPIEDLKEACLTPSFCDIEVPE